MLNLFQKIGTAMRASTRVGLKTVVNANSLQIFEQEIYEAESKLKKSKQHLSQIIADKLRLQKEIGQAKAALQQMEQQAQTYLQQGDEAAALQIAGNISQQEMQLQGLQTAHNQLAQHEQQLMEHLKNTSHKLKHYRTELRLAKADSKRQKVLENLSLRELSAPNSFEALQVSMDTIREQQDDFRYRMQAVEQVETELNPTSIIASPDAQKVLERLKQTQ